LCPPSSSCPADTYTFEDEKTEWSTSREATDVTPNQARCPTSRRRSVEGGVEEPFGFVRAIGLQIGQHDPEVRRRHERRVEAAEQQRPRTNGVTDPRRSRDMILHDTYTLSNGIQIPSVGLGTWFIDDHDAARAVSDATTIGYRHIDTAQAYGNEAGVGDGIRSCGVPREEIFVTTKLAADIKSYDEATTAIEQSLATTGLDQLDLMLIHSPQPWEEFGGKDRYLEGNREAWRALEDAYEAAKLRAIGVSNFQPVDIDNIAASCRVAPMVNQLLAHIANTPFELIDYSRERGMLVEAYSPIGHGELFKSTKVAVMAERYDVSVPQLAVRYTLQLGLLPLPKTANADHMRTNAEVDFEISEADMDTLRSIEPIEDYGDASSFPVYSRA
jgi:diketogulonate reductase-like aldo/keto reductase